MGIGNSIDKKEKKISGFLISVQENNWTMYKEKSTMNTDPIAYPADVGIVPAWTTPEIRSLNTSSKRLKVRSVGFSA